MACGCRKKRTTPVVKTVRPRNKPLTAEQKKAILLKVMGKTGGANQSS